jgi:hypothetical protein
MAAQAPDDPATISYEWALAMQQGRLDEAEGLVARARSAGVGAAVLEDMSTTTRAGRNRRSLRRALAAAATALLVTGLLLLTRTVLRRRLPARSPAA